MGRNHHSRSDSYDRNKYNTGHVQAGQANRSHLTSQPAITQPSHMFPIPPFDPLQATMMRFPPVFNQNQSPFLPPFPAPNPNYLNQTMSTQLNFQPLPATSNLNPGANLDCWPPSYNPNIPPCILPPNNNMLSMNPLDRLQLRPNQITDTGIIPNLPYYELPAGLMVPLIPANQNEYKPINPSDIRLPLPKFPDENFLKSIDNYYRNDATNRDSDGWDREFIDTFIGQKRALADIT